MPSSPSSLCLGLSFSLCDWHWPVNYYSGTDLCLVPSSCMQTSVYNSVLKKNNKQKRQSNLDFSGSKWTQNLQASFELTQDNRSCCSVY